MKEIKKYICTIDELPPAVRAKHVDKHRDINIDHGWWDWMLEGFCEDLNTEHGIDVNPKEITFDLYHNDFSFPVNTSMKDFLNKHPKHHERYQALRIFPYDLNIRIKDDGRGRMIVDGVDYLYYYHDAPSEEHEKLADVIMLSLVPAGMTLGTLWEELQQTILDTYRDEAAAMLKDLKNEENQLTKDEAIIDTLEANGYEFEYDEDEIKTWPNYKSLLQSLSLEKIRNDKKQKNLPQFGIELDDIKIKGDERSG
jgi:hypothetical protein